MCTCIRLCGSVFCLLGVSLCPCCSKCGTRNRNGAILQVVLLILFSSLFLTTSDQNIPVSILAPRDNILCHVSCDVSLVVREKLGIDLKILETISWNDVVQRLIRLHEHKIYRVAVKDRLTEHDVVSRVMRKENYMIALINKVGELGWNTS